MPIELDALETAQASYALRQKRFATAKERLHMAKQALAQAFELTFSAPNAAREKFTAIVERSGLETAIAKLQSSPTEIVPKWKALRGEHTLIKGQTREREQAREWLKRLPEIYRKAEAAHNAHDLSERLLEDADQCLAQLRGETPVVEQQAYPLRRPQKLGQRFS